MAQLPDDSECPNRRPGSPGVCGGKLDCKELVVRTTLYLRVFRKGALFYTRECYGRGEITVNANRDGERLHAAVHPPKGNNPRNPPPVAEKVFVKDPNPYWYRPGR